MSGEVAILCPQCQIGHLQRGQKTYVRVIAGMVISVPGMPALTCDVCGYEEFERNALFEVDALVEQPRRSANASRATTKTTPTETNNTRGLKP